MTQVTSIIPEVDQAVEEWLDSTWKEAQESGDDYEPESDWDEESDGDDDYYEERDAEIENSVDTSTSPVDGRPF